MMNRYSINTHKTVGYLMFMLVLMMGTTFAQDIPMYLKGRGKGTPTDMFGTYCRKGEFLIYPFFEYYMNSDGPYNPEEFGFGIDEDFEGKFHSDEWLLYIRLRYN